MNQIKIKRAALMTKWAKAYPMTWDSIINRIPPSVVDRLTFDMLAELASAMYDLYKDALTEKGNPFGKKDSQQESLDSQPRSSPSQEEVDMLRMRAPLFIMSGSNYSYELIKYKGPRDIESIKERLNQERESKEVATMLAFSHKSEPTISVYVDIINKNYIKFRTKPKEKRSKTAAANPPASEPETPTP